MTATECQDRIVARLNATNEWTPMADLVAWMRVELGLHSGQGMHDLVHLVATGRVEKRYSATARTGYGGRSSEFRAGRVL